MNDLSLTNEQLEIYNANEKLAYAVVNKVIKEMSTSVLFGYDDLIQIALISLCKAIKGYDPSKDVKFSTYAYVSIYKNIMIDIVRESKKNAMIINSVEEINEYLGYSDDFFNNIETDDILENVLKNANARQKRNVEMFVMKKVKNMKTIEIAKIYNISPSEASVYIGRGAKYLANSNIINKLSEIA